MSGKEYVGQVIIEKGFPTKARAEDWVARVSSGMRDGSVLADNVETAIWEPARDGVNSTRAE